MGTNVESTTDTDSRATSLTGSRRAGGMGRMAGPRASSSAASTAVEPAEGAPPGAGASPRAGRTPPVRLRASWWFRKTRRGQATGAFLAYAVASLGVFGLPILRHPGSTFVGWGTDPSSFMWYLAWFPHAVGHGINPLVTHEVWAPVGFNLTHATAVYAPAVALTPITLLFGPVVAYNAMALLTPVLAAWTAFLLCREITRSFWAALFGGYLFGFSVYVTGQMLGHPNLALVFLVPVCVLLVLRLVRGEAGTRRTALWLAAALVGQFLISLEVFMTLSLFGLVALGLAAATIREARPGIRQAAIAVAAAYGITAILMAPFLWSFFSASDHAPVYDFYPTIYATDLDNFAVPTQLTAAGSNSFRILTTKFTGDISEQSAYFSLPVLAMVGGFAIAFWRRRWSRWLLAVVGLVAVCSFGPKLHIGGEETIPMPWKLALHLPLVKYALPGRFLMYAWLGAAVMAAAWLGLRPGIGRWILPALAVIMLFPNLRGPFWHNDVREPAFFSTGAYRDVLPRDSTVLVVPYGANGDSMLWQADTGFWFRMPGGNVGTRPPPEFGHWPVMDVLYSGQVDPGSGDELQRFLGANNVRAVVVVDGTTGDWGTLFAPLGRPRRVQGVTVYTVPNAILTRYANAPRPPP
jgi:hypothetical protein